LIGASRWRRVAATPSINAAHPSVAYEYEIATECRPFSDDLPRVGRYRTDECSINPDCSND
jgi:hypothetical protein